MFAYHLLLPDLQMYILSQDPHLLLLAPRLNKSFYQRAQPYLYQKYQNLPLRTPEFSYYNREIHLPQWGYTKKNTSLYVFYLCSLISPQEYEYRVNFIGILRNTEPFEMSFYNSPHSLTFYKESTQVLADQSPSIKDHFPSLNLLEEVLKRRKLCLLQDPNYPRNYLIRYLSDLHTTVKDVSNKISYYYYLVLNLQIYNQPVERIPNFQEIKIIEQESEKLYFQLRTYLQRTD